MFDCTKMPGSLLVMVFMIMENQRKSETGLHWAQLFPCRHITSLMNLVPTKAGGMNTMYLVLH